MRKRITSHESHCVSPSDQNWLDLQKVAKVEVTSEDATHPIESALIPGAGMGPAIVKEIAERHGGKVWAEPGADEGITFYVSISKTL